MCFTRYPFLILMAALLTGCASAGDIPKTRLNSLPSRIQAEAKSDFADCEMLSSLKREKEKYLISGCEKNKSYVNDLYGMPKEIAELVEADFADCDKVDGYRSIDEKTIEVRGCENVTVYTMSCELVTTYVVKEECVWSRD